MMRVVTILRLATVAALVLSTYAGSAAAESFLAKKGQAQAAIVVGQQATAFDRWVAGLARQIAQQMIHYCNIPTEKYLLFRYNQNVIGSIEEDQKYLKHVMAQNPSTNN
jgi:hypothetical protein